MLHTLLDKIASLPPEFWLWGSLSLALALHFLWCEFVAYPSAFEREFRRSKPWVYIPKGWQGWKKFAILSVSRLLLVIISGQGTVLFVHYTQRRQTWIVAPVAGLFLLAMIRLDIFWTHFRYRQQEDAYYHRHDAVRASLESKGNDHTEAQVRRLAAYQHQQGLQKADASGKFLKVLRQEARLAHHVKSPHEPDGPDKPDET